MVWVGQGSHGVGFRVVIDLGTWVRVMFGYCVVTGRVA